VRVRWLSLDCRCGSSVAESVYCSIQVVVTELAALTSMVDVVCRYMFRC
jgi:hypothetical protein